MEDLKFQLKDMDYYFTIGEGTSFDGCSIVSQGETLNVKAQVSINISRTGQIKFLGASAVFNKANGEFSDIASITEEGRIIINSGLKLVDETDHSILKFMLHLKEQIKLKLNIKI